MWMSYKCGSLRKGFTAIRIFPVVLWVEVTHIYLIQRKSRSKVAKDSWLMEGRFGPTRSVLAERHSQIGYRAALNVLEHPKPTKHREGWWVSTMYTNTVSNEAAKISVVMCMLVVLVLPRWLMKHAKQF